MFRQATFFLVTLLVLAFPLQAAPPAEEAAAATPPGTSPDGVVPVELTDADLSGYLAAFPKMTAFMNERGAAFEASQAAGAASAAASMETEFEKTVGLPFGRFFEVHGLVTSAFAEALAARSRGQQKKTLDESIAELEKAVASTETSAAIRKEMLAQVDEMKVARKGLEQEPAPEPTLSVKTRQLVLSRLDEVERVFTEADSPAMAQEQKSAAGEAGEAGTTAPAGR
jgi:hypothetical protein